MSLVQLSAEVPALWDYDEVAAIAARRFGDRSQAVYFVLHDELIRVRTLLSTDLFRSPFLQSRIAYLRAQIQYLNDVGGYLRAGPAPHARIVSRHPTVLEYDRTVFDSRYSCAAEDVRSGLVHVKDRQFNPLQPGKCYMYVIDEYGELIVWNRAFRFADLVFGRNRATVHGVPVAHPLLVPETLRVCAAGEFIPFACDPTGATLGAAIVNTKSGHYRPPPTCVPLIEEVFDRIGLGPSDLDIFTLDPAIDAVDVAGPVTG